MRRLLAIALHPITYFRFKRMQEWFVLLEASTVMLKIDDPSVWDVDRIQENINRMYDVFHKDPTIFDDMQTTKKQLFWTLLLSRFKRLEITREEAKMVLDFYDCMRNDIADIFAENGKPEEKVDVFTVVVHMNLMVQMFGNMI